ncbi:MAG: hypothetical protein NTW16_13385 [Bacteroidetes bacterium]|nr:hypothetical protein [Bacteroidota bacterium]
MKKKKVESEKIKCYSIFGVELFVNPVWEPMTKGKGIDGSFKVLHGEFFFRGSLEDCQIIVSEKFLNKFISEHDLILNVIEDQFVWTKNTKEVKRKLVSLEFEVEFLFLISENANLKPEDLDDDEDIEYIFKLIE